MPIAKDFTAVFKKDWAIDFSQCYPNRGLKIPELANLLQLTAAKHAEMGGLGFFDLQEDNQVWVMNRMRIEFYKWPEWLNKIEIKTWITELKGAKSNRNFVVSSGGMPYIGVSSLWAIFNTTTRRPDVLLKDKSHIDVFPELQATKELNQRLNLDFEPVDALLYRVQFSDLDIVNHVNNTKYLEWCLNVVDPCYILDKKIRAIDVNFLKELSLGDHIQIAKVMDANQIKFKILKDGQLCFGCVITLNL
ncbi:acyl-[acyl-carrier-protein] thioesterase [Sphingobacterium sp. Mn56C]|uniref:acyl-[acyl-carrier-protein] thioesterase n=1 Tax=Sphingobacterium sp. Mn56C TaxID=3395261 RepID=UPI003BE27B46